MKVEPLFPAPEGDDLSSHLHRQLIGGLGLVLPVLLWLIAGSRPMEGLPRWEPLSSISAYYYTGAVAAFVGVLIALAVFLFTYRGYDNAYRRRDRIAAIVAGTAAALVAFFPTEAPGDLPRPSWWTPPIATTHYVSAAVLFASFIFFSLFLFPKSKVEKGRSLPLDKRVRNWIYVACGVAMVACILWVAGALSARAPIFWPEALALEFFAVSWLAKGRADWTALAAGRRSLQYGRHSGRLIGKAWRTLRGSPDPTRS